MLSQNVNNFEGWSINLYHGVEEFVRWITILSHISESLWQESKVCLTVSKNSRSEVHFCHILLEKIVAVITSLTHDVNNFVSCIEVLFRSVKSSERESKTLFYIVELFVSAFKILSDSAENVAPRITNLSSCVETFVSWTKVLYGSAKNPPKNITIFSNGVEIFVRWTTVFSQLYKKLCPDSKFCLKVTKNLWIALKCFLSVKKTESLATFSFHNVENFLNWFTIVSHNSEKIVARITSLSHNVKKFVGWFTSLSHSAKKFRGGNHYFVSRCQQFCELP